MFQPPSDEVRAQRSSTLNQLVGNGLPDLNMMMDPLFFPFEETACCQVPREHGVIHMKNIPFNTTRQELIALIGRNSKILNDNEEPVHIIMERVSSKTNDAYIEVYEVDHAIDIVDRLNSKGRVSRLGDRPIDIEVSSQSQLMRDLFPIARGIIWHGSMPEIKPRNELEPWDSFKTFVTPEEMTMLIKHVEVPQRSPFSRDCPERAYECMISTIKKMPWYMTQHITIKQRHYIWDACAKLVSLLIQALNPMHRITNDSDRYERAGTERLTPQLLRRFTNAIMLCPGFSVCQKDNIASLVSMSDHDLRMFNMPRFAESWLHQYTLGPKPGVPLDVLEYYIAIIREETHRVVQALPISEKERLVTLTRETDGYWGYIWYEIGYPRGHKFDNLTLAEVAAKEWGAIDIILRRAL
ncbi:hypothetical protein BX600DRAFT_389019, partial [Xylariales sp. PMI_506]